MNEQPAGLAQQAMGQQPQFSPEEIQQVIELLKQGITPEQLMQQGAPQGLIEAALQILQEQMVPNTDGGLAQQMGGM